MWLNSFLITNLNTDISFKKLKIHAAYLTFTLFCFRAESEAETVGSGKIISDPIHSLRQQQIL